MIPSPGDLLARCKHEREIKIQEVSKALTRCLNNVSNAKAGEPLVLTVSSLQVKHTGLALGILRDAGYTVTELTETNFRDELTVSFTVEL